MLSTCERIFLHKVLQAMFTKRIEQDIRIAFRTIFQPTQNFHLFPNKTFIFSPIWPQSFHKYHSYQTSIFSVSIPRVEYSIVINSFEFHLDCFHTSHVVSMSDCSFCMQDYDNYSAFTSCDNNIYEYMFNRENI